MSRTSIQKSDKIVQFRSSHIAARLCDEKGVERFHSWVLFFKSISRLSTSCSEENLTQYLLGMIKTSPARLAQSVEHQTFNLRVMGSSPISGGTSTSFFLAQSSLLAQGMIAAGFRRAKTT